MDTTHVEKWIDCLPLNAIALKGTLSYLEAVNFTFCTSDLNLEYDSELPIESRAKVWRIKEPNKDMSK